MARAWSRPVRVRAAVIWSRSAELTNRRYCQVLGQVAYFDWAGIQPHKPTQRHQSAAAVGHDMPLPSQWPRASDAL